MPIDALKMKSHRFSLTPRGDAGARPPRKRALGIPVLLWEAWPRTPEIIKERASGSR